MITYLMMAITIATCFMLTSSVYIKTFTNEIEIGSFNVDLNIVQISFQNSLRYIGTLTFISPKTNSNYISELSYNKLQVSILFNKFCFIVRSYINYNQTSLSYIMNDGCGDGWKVLQIRYIIIERYVTFIRVYILFQNQLSIISQTRIIRFNIPITTINNATAKLSHYISSMKIYNTQNKNLIDIDLSFSLYNTSVQFRLYNNLLANVTYLQYIRIAFFIVDMDQLVSEYGGTFEQYYIPMNGNYRVYTNSTSNYLNGSIFWGIRSMHSQNIKLSFQFNLLNINSIAIDTMGLHFVYLQLQVISFVIIPCLISQYYYQTNKTCYNTCPQSTFLYIATSQCLLCSNSCLTCSVSYDNCTSCINYKYLSINSCLPCLIECSNCTSLTFCGGCVGQWLTLVNGRCLPQCGNSIIFRNEQCDDNNTANGDGCSSQCLIEDYFHCTNSSPSICSISNINIIYDYTIKVSKENSIISYFKIEPKLASLSNINWSSVINIRQNFMSISSIQYDRQQFKLIVKSSYSSDISKKALNFNFNYQNQTSLFASVNSSSISFQSKSQNNLSLLFYTKGQYQMASILDYICILISLVSLLMLFIGYIDGKLIVLEQIAIIQLTWICLITVKQAIPTFQSLRWLRLTFGMISLRQYNFSIKIDQQIKGISYQINPFWNYCLSLIAILIPILISLIILLVIKYKISRKEQKFLKWRKYIVQNTFYGLFFCAYIIFASLIINLMTLSQPQTQKYYGTTIGFIFIIIYVFYLIGFSKYPRYFGQFKSKFQKFNINQNFYMFVCIQRLISVIIIFTLKNIDYGLFFEMIIIGLQLLFVILSKPYVCGDYVRPILNLSFTLFILFLISLSNILQYYRPISSFTYIPFVIVLTIMVSLAINFRYLIISLKNKYEDFVYVNSHSIQKVNNTKFQRFQQNYKEDEAEDIVRKNEQQFKLFEKRFMQGNSMLLNVFNTLKLPKNEFNLKLQWERYDKTGIIIQQQINEEFSHNSN